MNPSTWPFAAFVASETCRIDRWAVGPTTEMADVAVAALAPTVRRLPDAADVSVPIARMRPAAASTLRPNVCTRLPASVAAAPYCFRRVAPVETPIVVIRPRTVVILVASVLNLCAVAFASLPRAFSAVPSVRDRAVSAVIRPSRFWAAVTSLLNWPSAALADAVSIVTPSVATWLTIVSLQHFHRRDFDLRLGLRKNERH